MGRYRLNPETGNLDHFHAVEQLARRLQSALGDWAKNDAFNGDPLRVLHDAILVTLGPKTVNHLFYQQQQERSDSERIEERQ